MAEYYFDYEIERVSGDESIETPKIYFERDCSKPDISYSMYAVMKEWLGKQAVMSEVTDEQCTEERRSLALSRLPYDEVEVLFDHNGIDCKALLNNANRKNCNNYTFVKFYREGAHVPILSGNLNDYSGVGILKFKKHIGEETEDVACFFFAVNFTFKKKIEYYINSVVHSGKRSGLVLKFVCPSRPKGICVKLGYKRNCLPCLKGDALNGMRRNLVFDENGVHDWEIMPLSSDMAAPNNVFSVCFADERLEKYYILECRKNVTMQNMKHAPELDAPRQSCPYCHSLIVTDSKEYKQGSVPCHYPSGINRSELPVILERNRKNKKKCIFCVEDIKVNDDGEKGYIFKEERLLPDEYLAKRCYKIAFHGPNRSGKTTYMSRLFDIHGVGRKANMPMTTARNALERLGINVSSTPIHKLETINDANGKHTGKYKVSDEDWTLEESFYVERRIDLYPEHHVVQTTQTDDGAVLPPLIATVNNQAYFSFYDIAGEDARNGTRFSAVAGGQKDAPIGVLLMIKGNSDPTGMSAVFNQLTHSEISRKSPVAVIVTKMDIWEQNLDSNCFCRRTDYSKKSVDKYIDYSSEEIRSYLVTQNGFVDIQHAGDNSFENVKYFGVSTFNFRDSIHANDDTDDDKAEAIRFECSSRGLELPFYWMIKQFGVK